MVGGSGWRAWLLRFEGQGDATGGWHIITEIRGAAGAALLQSPTHAGWSLSSWLAATKHPRPRDASGEEGREALQSLEHVRRAYSLRESIAYQSWHTSSASNCHSRPRYSVRIREINSLGRMSNGHACVPAACGCMERIVLKLDIGAAATKKKNVFLSLERLKNV